MLESLQAFMGDLSVPSVVLRLLLATAYGGLIGYDRRIKNNNAGIRTHALVCLGSALVMMTGEYVALRFPDSRTDLTTGSQVVSGISFLGAGTIIVTGRNRVHGLSAAAGIWAVACIGLAMGSGFVEGATVGVIFMLFIMRILNHADQRLRRHSIYFDLYVEFVDQAVRGHRSLRGPARELL